MSPSSCEAMENVVRKMESSSTVSMRKERLGVFQMLKESLKIPIKNPNFVFFIFLTSYPLFCFLVLYETILQHVLMETAKVLLKKDDPSLITNFEIDYIRVQEIGDLIGKVSPNLLLGFFCLVIVYFLDLFNTIATVDVASIIHTGEKHISLKEMFYRASMETRFKGPLNTSLCSLALAFLIFLGLLSFAAFVFITSVGVPFVLLYGVLFIALLAKSIEWSAIWNMAIVISILEEKKQGDVALIISSFLTRCNRVGGFFLMLGFFGWGLSLRLLCLYEGWKNGGNRIVIIVAHMGLVCMANLLKWVAITIYFYDCKKQSSYNKLTDVEEGKVQE